MEKSDYKDRHYNNLAYRVCYGLTDTGNMDYSTPHYEFVKNCSCNRCTMRFENERLGLRNELTVTTDDVNLFPEVERILNDYTCNEKGYIGRQFITMHNGTVKQKILKIDNGKVKETIIE